MAGWAAVEPHLRKCTAQPEHVAKGWPAGEACNWHQLLTLYIAQADVILLLKTVLMMQIQASALDTHKELP